MFKNLTKKSFIFIATGLIVFLLIMIAVLFYFFKPYPIKFKNEIMYASEKYDIQPALIASIINAESKFNSNCTSSKGAVGLMQIMPTTASWLASLMSISFSKIQLYDPFYNVNMGSFYLSYLFKKFNDINTVLASYNAGEGNVRLWLLNSKYSTNGEVLTTTPFSQTNSYIEKVNDGLVYYYEIFQN